MSPFVSEGGGLSLSNTAQLELLRAVTERGKALRTTVRGFSMSPFIRDGDVATIVPSAGRTPRVGDVVAFTWPDTSRMAVHRIVAAENPGWLIRGDNCMETDGIVPEGNIVGFVVRVEHNGRDVRLGLGPERAWIARLSLNGGLLRLRMVWFLPHRAAGFLFRSAQATRFYRYLGRRFAPRVAIGEARDEDIETVHRMLNPCAPYRRQSNNPNEVNWAARSGNSVVGFVQYVYHPEDHYPWTGHWLFSHHVWNRYRGLGIGEALTKPVIETARKRNASEISLAVFEDNARAISLYRKHGFVQVTMPNLETGFAEEKKQSGRRRIIMCKTFIKPPTDGKIHDRDH